MACRWVLVVGMFIGMLEFSAQAPCGTDACHQHALATNEVYAMGAASMLEAWTHSPATSVQNEAVIPVVFHVIHTGSPYGQDENISDAQIQSAIVALNEDFRKVSGSNGDGDGVDTGISFSLARRDPDGAPTNGIVRVDGSGLANYAEEGIAHLGGVDGAPEQLVKGLSCWPADEYINVWVVNEIDDNDGGGGVQAFAYVGPTQDALDGITIMFNLVGTVGTLKPNDGLNRTMTHEFGHHLNLFHTFYDTSSCTPSTNCTTQGDRVCDTPPTTENGGCVASTCPDALVSNYMDYTPSSCKNMFTQGQADRMWTCLLNLRPALLSSMGGTSVVDVDLCLATTVDWEVVSSCGNGFTPKVRVINQGHAPVSDWSVSCWVDGQLHGTWEGGNFDLFGQHELVEFPLAPLTGGAHQVFYSLDCPADEWAPNNVAVRSLQQAPLANWVFAIQTDFFASQTSWSLDDSLNQAVFSGFGSGTGFSEFVYELCLSQGCYTLEVLDSGGDGLQWGGGFTLTDDLGNELVSVFDTNDQNIGFGQSYEVCTGVIPATEIEPSAMGCTYPFATNYNPAATVDNGSCYIGGCMDSTAINFQPLASAPLVPCEFAPDPSCFGDADGDGLVGLSDLLTFLSAMGQTCD